MIQLMNAHDVLLQCSTELTDFLRFKDLTTGRQFPNHIITLWLLHDKACNRLKSNQLIFKMTNCSEQVSTSVVYLSGQVLNLDIRHEAMTLHKCVSFRRWLKKEH